MRTQMHVGHPHTAVSPSLDGEVLRVLAGSGKPMTGRQVHGLVRLGSPRGVLNVLNRLSAHGIVTAESAGRAVLFALNREHLAATAVLELAGLRRKLFEQMSAALEKWRPLPVHASVFGSCARGDGDETSDIDFFLVRPKGCGEEDRAWRLQTFEFGEQVRRWTGNSLSTAEVSIPELNRLRRERPPIVASLEKEARTLFGPDIRKLLKRA